MTGEHLAAQSQRAARGIEQRLARTTRHLLPDDHLDHRQEQWQPGHGGNDHSKDGAHHIDRRELVGDPGEQTPDPIGAQRPGQHEHGDTSQPELEHGEPPIGLVERQEEKDQAEGIEGRMLTIGQKGRTSPKVGVPQRQAVGQPAGLA